MGARGSKATITVAKPLAEQAVAPVVRRRPPVPQVPEEDFEADVMREMKKISLDKHVTPTPASSAENTAVIRFHEEKRLDEYRLLHRTEHVPGRISEAELQAILTRYRSAPSEYTAEDISKEMQLPDPAVVANVLRFVTSPRIVQEGEDKVAV